MDFISDSRSDCWTLVAIGVNATSATPNSGTDKVTECRWLQFNYCRYGGLFVCQSNYLITLQSVYCRLFTGNVDKRLTRRLHCWEVHLKHEHSCYIVCFYSMHFSSNIQSAWNYFRYLTVVGFLNPIFHQINDYFNSRKLIPHLLRTLVMDWLSKTMARTIQNTSKRISDSNWNILFTCPVQKQTEFLTSPGID